MQIKSILELTLGLDKERFRKIFIKMCGKKRRDDEKYIDYSLDSEGITIAYRNSQYKKRITFTVDPSGAINYDNLDESLPKFIRNLDRAVTKYFNAKYELKDFALSKMILSTDIDLRARPRESSRLSESPTKTWEGQGLHAVKQQGVQ